ncbi:signal peptidase I [Pseudoalteromonas sp. JB197]|uniref:signal peptidase I n=1 Tax=Pseudoalteromonas sp. JB197 TaxID=1434839 RepID=UPI00097E83E4|nr:signal peptidase I [Pseudoalteromonas sp. JB197]PCC12719.1 signal peptidase I [Pseudoalteromonas sp. JB197]SJN36829.1 Signal peptidase I [Pseudoalteromonas sp. JB197]
MKTLIKFWKNNRSLIIFIALMSVFRSAVADWYEVPTGSMRPTIEVGDRVLTNKMAYDLRLPFTHIPLMKLGDPQAGDIIVFDSKKADNRLIKRVIGVPGDTVSLEDNELIINGKKLNYARLHSNLGSLDKITIPNNYYLAMGDNRDNSADSRVIGLIPRSEMLGKAERVIVSLDYDNYYLPRCERFLKRLE